MNNDRTLTATHVAKRLGTTVETLRKWAEKGQGPPALELPDGRLRYVESALSKWEQERAVGGPPG